MLVYNSGQEGKSLSVMSAMVKQGILMNIQLGVCNNFLLLSPLLLFYFTLFVASVMLSQGVKGNIFIEGIIVWNKILY